MRRRAKPAKTKVEGNLAPAHKSRKDEGSRVRDLEKRLAEAQKREAEAQEQQTATAEILGVISRSPTDLQPVFEAIVRSAVRLCDGVFSIVGRFDGEYINFGAEYNFSPEAVAAYRRWFPRRAADDRLAGRAVLEQRVMNVGDVTAEYRFVPGQQEQGFRSVIFVPMVRDGVSIGVIGVSRMVVGAFPDQQVKLLQTFADQAVIAIENVRVFTELQEKNRAVTEAHERVSEALDQQTATSEILRVISSSPTDAQPVFDTIVRSSDRLLGGLAGSLALRVGDEVHLVALTPTNPGGDAVLRRLYPMPIGEDGGHAEVVRLCRPLMITDTEAELTGRTREFARIRGFRSRLSVPLIRDGIAIGSLGVTRAAPGAFTDREIALLQTFADQAVIAIENVRLFKELQARNRDLTEALEQQTATAEILGVISRSQTDVQPVFDAIVASAVRLLGAYTGALTRVAGDQIELAALTSTDDGGDAALKASFPRPLHSAAWYTQVIRDRAPVNIADAQTDPRVPEGLRAVARTRDFRSWVVVLLLRHDEVMGTISVTRREPGGFTDDEIALLQTFADQAVIAIENVRLFKELEERNRALTESLDQQTATSEILRVISSSPTDIQPVLDAMAESASRLCDSVEVAIFRRDADRMHLVANRGSMASVPMGTDVVPLAPGTVIGRSILEGRAIHVTDVQVEYAEYPVGSELARQLGHRTILSVPLMRERVAVGAIALRRVEERPFTDRQIALLQTFADQAVIAIENVRLFTELQEKNRALTAAHAQVTEALEQQTATSEILRVISGSPTNIQPVFDTIVKSVARLCDGMFATVHRFEGELLHWVAQHNYTDEGLEAMRATFPMRPTRDTVSGRAIVDRTVINVRDLESDPDAPPRTREIARAFGFRSIIAVPMLREGRPIGAIAVARQRGSFSEEQIQLLETFADQAVIAIENVRLFNELAVANGQLEAASHHKSEFLANMSHELRTPLNAVIGFSEVLLQRMFGELNAKQDEYLKDIYASGQHLLSLINDILDLSKIEAGRMELAPAPFHLPSALENAVTLVRERAARHGITLQVDIDPGLGEVVGDERKVKQVLLNLLSNAVKFTPEGGRISLKASRRDGAVEVSVTDTGIGIAPEDQAAIFEEFRQVGSDETRKQEGTGLGLTLAKKFVELHGGRVWVESEVGRGSTFTFTLPLR